MPEGLITEPQSIKKFKEGRLLRESDLRDSLEKEDFQFLGMGKESIVIKHPDNDGEVVAFVYDRFSPVKSIDRFEALKIYHNQRIWQALFPDHFPKITMSSGGEKARTVRQRISRGRNIDKTEHPFEEVFDECKRNDLPIPKVDNWDFNFMVGEDGNEYYVDLLSNSNKGEVTTDWDRDKLAVFMRKKFLDASTQKKVLASEQRLREILVAQAMIKLEKNKEIDKEDVDRLMERFDFEAETKEGQEAQRRVRRMVTIVRRQ